MMEDLVVTKLLSVKDEGTTQSPLVIDGERARMLHWDPKSVHLMSVSL